MDGAFLAIRDPSDGSVKKKPIFISDLAVTGLHGLETENSDEDKRLQRAREWLEDWKKRDLDNTTLPLSDEQKSSG